MTTTRAQSLGYVAVVIGSAVAIAAGVIVSKSATPLWAFLLTMFLVEKVRDTSIKYDPYRPLTLGLIMGALCLMVAGVIWYLSSPEPLWSLILIGLMVEVIMPDGSPPRRTDL